MKKSLMLAGALMMSTLIFAQNDDDSRGDHHKRRGDRGEEMKTVLSLDDTQYNSIKEINKKYGEKQKALRQDSTMQRDDRFKAHKILQEQRTKEVNKVLTKEQSTKWTSYKKERAEKRKAEFEKRSKERDEKLKSDLSLSDDQLKKLKDARKSTHEKMKDLHEKKAGDKEQYKKVRDEHDAKVKSILTPEQYTKMKDMRAKKGEHKRGHRNRH
jgi:Spy/CpxP family protein refolding chaperone